MPTAPVNGIEIYYEIEGVGAPIVFCHGAGGNHMSWWQQVPFFSTHYRCVTFDHRGFGRSLNPPGAPGAIAFVDDLAGLLDSLRIEKVYLVAQSMGGRTALGLTARQPDRVKALVMAGTIGNIAHDGLRLKKREANRHLPKNRLEVALSPRVAKEKPQWAYLYKSIQMLNPSKPPQFFFGERALSIAPEKLGQIAMPVLFIVGEEDPIVPPDLAEMACGLLPKARLLRVPRAGHSVYFEKPDAFNSVVLDFLAQAG